MLDKLKQLIEESDSILITSHIGPDGDSISSSLLLSQILKLNYGGKNICVSMEEEPYGLDFLAGYSDIRFQPLPEAIKSIKPGLIILLDANGLKRATRKPEEVGATMDVIQPKLVIVDHHEQLNIDQNDLYINNDSPAVTLDIFDIFIEKLGLRKPDDYAQTALTGIYTDTGGFVHQSPNYSRIFEVIPTLLSDGASLELIVSHLNQVTEETVIVTAEILANTSFKDDFTYSFISDKTAKTASHEALIKAADIFRNEFARSVREHPWGFIVYRDLLGGEELYSVSMRALTGKKDVSLIAGLLGGGGHKPAAGAKFKATSVEEAVNKVLSAIEQAANS